MKKVMFLTQIPLCNFFSAIESFFLLGFSILQQASKREHPRKCLPVKLK